MTALIPSSMKEQFEEERDRQKAEQERVHDAQLRLWAAQLASSNPPGTIHKTAAEAATQVVMEAQSFYDYIIGKQHQDVAQVALQIAKSVDGAEIIYTFVTSKLEAKPNAN